MLRRSGAAAGLGLLAAVCLATTACATTGTPAPPTKPATEVLADAAAKGQGQSFTFTQTYGTMLNSNGAQEAGGQNWKSAMTLSDASSGLTIKGEMLSIGSELFLKLDMGGLAGVIPGLAGLGQKWMRLDKTKIGTGGLGSGLVSGGSTNAESYIKGVLTAEHVSDTEIKGTLDLTKSSLGVVSAQELAALGPEAKKVPFAATLDSEGRIAKIVISMPKVGDFPASDLTTNFADYGSPVSISKPPASEVVEAPAMVYQFMA